MRENRSVVPEGLKNILSSDSRFVLLTHKNPDGDAIGSILALTMFLKSMGKEAVPIFPNATAPEFLDFPHMEHAVYADKNPERCRTVFDRSEVVICLDFNASQRVDSFLGGLLLEPHRSRVLIDHHESPEDIFEVVYSRPGVSSTAEMVFELISQMPAGDFSIDMASCLYAGIFTDTGGFKFGTDAGTHRVVANLLEKGVNAEELYQKIYHRERLSRIQLKAHLLSQHLHYLPEYHTAYIVVSTKTLKDFSCRRGDYEGVVNVPLTIDKVKLSCVFVEEERTGKVKMSLRSRGNFSVADFASLHFNGGGHFHAAGGLLKSSLDDAVSRFVGLLSTHIDDLK